jgi:hypothetical protein
MEKLHFSIDIKAPIQKVWDILWADETYRKWTTAFSEGSYAESDWNEGSKIVFLGPGGDGMLARIAEKREPHYMGFEHLGMIIGGVEDTTSDKVKGWAGARENYTLSEKNGQTNVHIDIDITEEYKEMFSQMWPKALQSLKQLAEQ